MKKWSWILGGAFAVVLSTWALLKLFPGVRGGWLVVGALSLVGFSFLWVFNHKKPKWWFWYSYSFMVLALGLSVVPFTLEPSSGVRDNTEPISILRGCAILEDAPWAVRCSSTETNRAGRDQWVVNFGGLVFPTADPAKSHKIQGGLVVPLYFIVLALVGAAISMTRRIPEYQKRADPAFRPTPEEPFLDEPTLREFLVFQIVQFVSAPLLAIATFHLFDLETLKTLVPLGFIVGFSSETVLMMIRAAVTKLKPVASSSPQLGSIWGKAEDSEATPLSGVKVTLVGKPKIEASTGTDGSYVLEDVPAGKRSLKFTGKDQTKLKNVAVVTGTAVECNVKLE